MSVLMDYKCPCCGAPLSFDSQAQKMKCEYCSNEFDTDTLKSYDEVLKQDAPDNMDWASQPGNEWMKEELEGKCVYLCNSCGGQIISDESTGATSCPYCTSPVVIMGQFSGDMRPDVIIPFKLDKEAAKAAFKKHLEGKRLLPKSFKSDAYIDEIKGIYVPFWLFDAKADGNIRFKATKVRSWRSGNFRYTETSYYAVHRKGNLRFEAVPVDGSSKLANDLTESIEPYDMGDAVSFQTAFLSGYLADRYDVTADESIERVNQRIKTSTEQSFRETVTGYTTVFAENSSVSLSESKVSYAMFPVWLLSGKWQDKVYTFAMNGQTGKFVGNLPMDKGAYWRWFALSGLIGAAVATVLALLLSML